MRAAVLKELGAPFVVEEVELLPPGPGRVIVRTGASAFCSTDCMNQAGKLGKVPPTILGHASMGVVEEVGPGVAHLRRGQRVVVPGTPECGTCFYCAAGRPDQCSELFDAPYPEVARLATGEPVSAAGAVGGYAERMNVSANHAFAIETDLPDEHVCLLGCGVTTGLGAVFNVARVRAGESVAVAGCGHLGLWMVQAARVAGAARIIAVDPHEGRRALALQLGATDAVDPGEGDAVERVRALTGGRGADHGLEAAGPAASQRDVFLMTRRAGTVVLTGVERLDAQVTLPQVALALQGRRILSCQNGNVRMRRDIPRYVRMLETGVVTAEPIVTARYPLDAVNDALAASAELRDLSGVVIPER